MPGLTSKASTSSTWTARIRSRLLFPMPAASLPTAHVASGRNDPFRADPAKRHAPPLAVRSHHPAPPRPAARGHQLLEPLHQRVGVGREAVDQRDVGVVV